MYAYVKNHFYLRGKMVLSGIRLASHFQPCHVSRAGKRCCVPVLPFFLFAYISYSIFRIPSPLGVVMVAVNNVYLKQSNHPCHCTWCFQLHLELTVHRL